jgi:hypothetical protein
MHILSRIRSPQDPWEKVTLFSLQQFAEDMRINEKRVCALEKSIVTLTDVLVGSGSEEQQGQSNVTTALQDLHEEIRAWSKQSLDRAEELAVAVRQVVADQGLEPVTSSPTETKQLAS